MPLIPRSIPVSTENDTLFTERTIFNVLSLLGVFLNAAVLLPALCSRNVHRGNGWYNVLVSWILYSLSYLLILGYQTGPEPPFGICLAQATLIYSCPTLCALSLACLLIDYDILASSLTYGRNEGNPWVSKLLILLPWVAFVLMGYIVLMLTVEPSVVIRRPGHFYCSIKTDAPTLVSAIVIFASSAIVLAVEAHIVTILCRHWGAFSWSNLNKPYLSLSMFLRLTLLNLMILVADGLDVAAMKQPGGDGTVSWTMVVATIPILAALTFGTQRDILRVYIFWRKRENSQL